MLNASSSSLRIIHFRMMTNISNLVSFSLPHFIIIFLYSFHLILFSVSLYPSHHCLLFNALPPVTHSVIKGSTIKATVYKQTTLALYWDQFHHAPPALRPSGDQTATDSGSVPLVFGVSHGEVYIRHNFICQMLLEADQSTAVPQRISEHSFCHESGSHSL